MKTCEVLPKVWVFSKGLFVGTSGMTDFNGLAPVVPVDGVEVLRGEHILALVRTRQKRRSTCGEVTTDVLHEVFEFCRRICPGG